MYLITFLILVTATILFALASRQWEAGNEAKYDIEHREMYGMSYNERQKILSDKHKQDWAWLDNIKDSPSLIASRQKIIDDRMAGHGGPCTPNDGWGA